LVVVLRRIVPQVLAVQALSAKGSGVTVADIE
jgi:hypothetical protein